LTQEIIKIEPIR